MASSSSSAHHSATCQKKNRITHPPAAAAFSAASLKVKKKGTAPAKAKKKTAKAATNVSGLNKHHRFGFRGRSWPTLIVNMKDQIVESMRNCQVLIVVAHSNSLRTLLIPLLLADAGFASGPGPDMRIACTLPRSGPENHIAESIRAASGYLRNLNLKVSYRKPIPEVVCSGTVIKVMSVDCLLQEMAGQDKNLSSYSVVMVDEAHERTLSTDLLLGFLLPLLVRRQTPSTNILRLVLTMTPSAELEAVKLSAFFGRHCRTRTVTLPARPPPPPIISYIDPRSIARDDGEDYLEVVLSAVLQVHCSEPTPGSILLFLGGSSAEGLEKVCRRMKERIANSSNPKDKTLLVHALYYGSRNEICYRGIETRGIPHERSLFILSPEVSDAHPDFSEMSYVVDPGIGKHGAWISHQSADDRARYAYVHPPDGPSKCFRLYTESVYQNEMPPTTLPEILTCRVEELSAALRLMKQLGIASPFNFNFIDHPSPQALVSAMEMAALPDISSLCLQG